MIWGRGSELWTEGQLGEWKVRGTVGTKWRRNEYQHGQELQGAREREGEKMPIFQIWRETLFSSLD